jgi:hypothetical protein
MKNMFGWARFPLGDTTPCTTKKKKNLCHREERFPSGNSTYVWIITIVHGFPSINGPYHSYVELDAKTHKKLWKKSPFFFWYSKSTNEICHFPVRTRLVITRGYRIDSTSRCWIYHGDVWPYTMVSLYSIYHVTYDKLGITYHKWHIWHIAHHYIYIYLYKLSYFTNLN